jgi:hypothetical protein
VVAQAPQVWLTASQTCGEAQVPQLSALPQPSAAVPQENPRLAQVNGVQAPQEWVVALHDCPVAHVPQLMAWAQSLRKTPQVAPNCAQVVLGVGGVVPPSAGVVVDIATVTRAATTNARERERMAWEGRMDGSRR